MFLEPHELKELLKKEDEYISSLLARWEQTELPPVTENKLRIGKRLELLGDLQKEKESSYHKKPWGIFDVLS